MGGNALGFETARLKKDDYFALYARIKRLLPVVELIPSYRQKPDFGDMDLLYSKGSFLPCHLIEKLHQEFRVRGEYNNGDVLSVGVNVDVPYSDCDTFQIDFIGVPPDSLTFAYNYFSYNDLGNLIGRVARRINLKFGHKGLFYVQREGDHVLKEHLLTNQFSTALYHLGYDADRFYEGFDTLEEMFEFVMSSRFYDFNKFDLSQRNHKARIRDEKRPNYRAFLEYAQAHPKEQRIISDEADILTYSHGAFPEFYRDYYLVLGQNKLHKEFKRKYNGTLVMRVTGLKGKELGEFMEKIKPFLTQENVLKSSEEEIESAVEGLYRLMYPSKMPEKYVLKYDMTGTIHEGAGGCTGKLLEGSIQDDWDGMLTCTKCGTRVKRWRK